MPKIGDIYLVRFHPSTAKELKRYRPAVSVSQKVIDIDPRFALIAPLTTYTKPANSAEILITNPALEKPSLLLSWYLWTIDQSRLVKKLGQLTPKDISKIIHAIESLFSP